MNFDFSAEQMIFKDEVRKALSSACPLGEVRRVVDSGAPYSEPAWNVLRTLGVTAAAIPESYGGLGLGYYELCLAAEEVGRAVAPTPLGSSVYLAAEALLLAGSQGQKHRWLPEIATGEAVAAFATAHRSSVPSVQGEMITGASAPVYDALSASVAIVLADEGGRQSLFLVDLNQKSVARRPLKVLDDTRAAGELTFAGARAERLGAPGEGPSLVDTIRQRAAVLFAFEQVGGADRALEMARDYALQRRAFGRLIGSYQAIKHKLANVYIKNQLARAHAMYAAWALNSAPEKLPVAAAAAHTAATAASSFAAQENIQVHGGIGFTWDSDCQFFYKRARSLALLLGSALDWKERIVAGIERSNSLPGSA